MYEEMEPTAGEARKLMMELMEQERELQEEEREQPQGQQEEEVEMSRLCLPAALQRKARPGSLLAAGGGMCGLGLCVDRRAASRKAGGRRGPRGHVSRKRADWYLSPRDERVELLAGLARPIRSRPELRRALGLAAGADVEDIMEKIPTKEWLAEGEKKKKKKKRHQAGRANQPTSQLL